MEPPVNPYATPATDPAETWTAAEPIEEDGFLKFDVRLTQDSVCKILRWRGGWKTIVIPVFLSACFAAIFLFLGVSTGGLREGSLSQSSPGYWESSFATSTVDFKKSRMGRKAGLQTKFLSSRDVPSAME